MNRRQIDRRNVARENRGIYSQKNQTFLTLITLIISVTSLVVSLTRGSGPSISDLSSLVSPVETIVPEEAQSEIQKFHSTVRSKVEVKKHHVRESAARERPSHGPKRVRISFEDSVARAPASEPAPASTGTKVIKYSNDLYEKEDLL